MGIWYNFHANMTKKTTLTIGSGVSILKHLEIYYGYHTQWGSLTPIAPMPFFIKFHSKLPFLVQSAKKFRNCFFCLTIGFCRRLEWECVEKLSET